ncbi:MAG: response regulator transcription factor [Bacillota bacterium]|nr:response regulator transcription factor [Bacillota bacterium]
MYKILIVEDDMTIAKTLSNHLSKWNYEMRYVTDFKNVYEEFMEFQPQLVLMDIMLPFYNGYHWCTEIRKVSKVPVIFISSMSDNMNIVMAMNMGGDEFIEKPFDLNVVTAKIQALLRRTYAFQGAVNVIEHQGIMLNISDATVTYREKKLALTKNDYKILQILLENAGRIVAREEIMTRLWESDEFIDDNTLTVNVTRLRKKLEELGLKDFIVTKKGIGYIIL